MSKGILQIRFGRATKVFWVRCIVGPHGVVKLGKENLRHHLWPLALSFVVKTFIPAWCCDHKMQSVARGLFLACAFFGEPSLCRPNVFLSQHSPRRYANQPTGQAEEQSSVERDREREIAARKERFDRFERQKELTVKSIERCLFLLFAGIFDTTHAKFRRGLGLRSGSRFT